MLNLEEALAELKEKNLNDIQIETAWKWASRSAASYQNCVESQGLKKMACFVIGEEYFHEAVEHAALVEGQDLLSEIKNALVPYQEKAAQDVDRMFGNETKTDNSGK